MRLLDKSESSRLGSMTGASEVKAHKWFSKINWGLLRNTKPPVSVTFLLSREARGVPRFRGRRHRHHGAGRRYAILGRGLEDCSSSTILGGLGKTSRMVAIEATQPSPVRLIDVPQTRSMPLRIVLFYRSAIVLFADWLFPLPR